MPYLMISAMPASRSRCGKLVRLAMSASTSCGWWNAPIMFLPRGWLTPVLPPTDESTCASKVVGNRSEEHTSELQSLMRISYAVFCLKKKKVMKKSTLRTLQTQENTTIPHDHISSVTHIQP